MCDQLIRDTEAARIIGTTPVRLRNSRVSGMLGNVPTPPFIKLGRAVRYRKSDLERWLADLPTYQNTAQVSGKGAA